jgi:uncharacterized protein
MIVGEVVYHIKGGSLMKVAIMSDTHDHIWALDKAATHLVQVDVVLHCGDLCSPFMIPRLAQAAHGKPVHIVWGNNDGDKRLLVTQAQKFEQIQLHGDIALLDLDGFRVAVNHYPEVGRALAHSGQFDLVCYGHDHTAHSEHLGECLLLNPGELMGLNGRRSFALFDTARRVLEWIDVQLS